MTSADDPFIAVEPFKALKAPDHVTVRIYPHGGHLGFLGWDGSGGFRWAGAALWSGPLTHTDHSLIAFTA